MSDSSGLSSVAESRGSSAPRVRRIAGAIEAKDYIGMMESVGFTNISITPVFFEKETMDSAIADMGNVIELTTISRDDVYKAVYSAKITAHKPA